MKKIIILFSALASSNIMHAMDNNKQLPQGTICVPYADIYEEPTKNPDKLDTQVLFYEPVDIIEKQGEWYKVRTPWQTKVDKETNKQLPHEGWIEKDNIILEELHTNYSHSIIIQKPKLSLSQSGKSNMQILFAGTKLYNYHAGLGANYSRNYKVAGLTIEPKDALSIHEIGQFTDEQKRDFIEAFARTFENTPYKWGGLTADGIDCSGLTHLSYRAVLDKKIPRDSNDQFAAAQKRDPKNLQKGDLLFFARANEQPDKIRHVAFYINNDQIIHAIHTDRRLNKEWKKVLITTGQEWLGKPFTQMEQGEVVGPYVVYGGTFLP